MLQSEPDELRSERVVVVCLVFSDVGVRLTKQAGNAKRI